MPNGSYFADDHISVELFDFVPSTGIVQIRVDENHGNVGFYYIWVNFESGDSTRIDYDGANPQREQYNTVRTNHENDKIKEILVERVRD
jgi:hypothetical protein